MTIETENQDANKADVRGWVWLPIVEILESLRKAGMDVWWLILNITLQYFDTHGFLIILRATERIAVSNWLSQTD